MPMPKYFSCYDQHIYCYVIFMLDAAHSMPKYLYLLILSSAFHIKHLEHKLPLFHLLGNKILNEKIHFTFKLINQC